MSSSQVSSNFFPYVCSTSDHEKPILNLGRLFGGRLHIYGSSPRITIVIKNKSEGSRIPPADYKSTSTIMTPRRCLLILFLNAALLAPSHAVRLPSPQSETHEPGFSDGKTPDLEARHVAPGSTGLCGPRAGCVSNAATSDCCGPTGRNTILPDTCFSSANLTNSPGVFDIMCTSTGPANALQPASPVDHYTATVVCDSINNGTAKPNSWYWYTPQTGFALGVWLPGNAGDAPCPYWEQCYQNIYYMLIQACASTPGYNGGSINVAVLPDTSQSGRAVDAGYPSYIMAPAPLTN